MYGLPPFARDARAPAAEVVATPGCQDTISGFAAVGADETANALIKAGVELPYCVEEVETSIVSAVPRLLPFMCTPTKSIVEVAVN